MSLVSTDGRPPHSSSLAEWSNGWWVRLFFKLRLESCEPIKLWEDGRVHEGHVLGIQTQMRRVAEPERRVLAYPVPESAIGMMKITGHLPFNANYIPTAAAPWRFMLGRT